MTVEAPRSNEIVMAIVPIEDLFTQRFTESIIVQREPELSPQISMANQASHFLMGVLKQFLHSM